MNAGWEIKRFGEVLDIRNGRNQRDVQSDTGQFPILGSAGKVMGYATDYLCEAGTTIIGRKGTINSPIYVETCFWNVDTAFGLAPTAALDPKFLHYFCLSYDFALLNCGTTIPSLVKTDLLKIEIPLPPIKEQQRIAAVLDKAFAGIATATANAQKNLTCARELSTSCPTSSSDAERVSIGELLARGWLLDHMDGNHGGDYPRKDEFVAEGVIYLSANSIRDGEVDFGRAKFLAPARAAKLRKGFARNRDVLFAHNATVGPVALLETQADFVVLGTSLTYYRCDESHIKPEYLASYLASSAFKVQYESIMRQSTRNQIPITKQREFYVDIPPIDEQARMIASLTGFQETGRKLVTQYKAKFAALKELKQALLQKAFAGDLT